MKMTKLSFLVSEICNFLFLSSVKELEFECVPTSLMDQVLNFLNVSHWWFSLVFYLNWYLFKELQEVRDDLRCSMAKDAVTIKNESLKSAVISNNAETSCNVDKLHTQTSTEMSRDFQKKITPSKYEQNDSTSNSLFSSIDSYKHLLGM